MRFVKLGTLAAISVLASATAAFAGDTQRNCNGFYLGANFGSGSSANESIDGVSPAFQPQFPSRPASEPGSHDLGPHSGFQAGHNWQIANSPVVLRIEGDQSR
jgi:hypothetical protein